MKHIIILTALLSSVLQCKAETNRVYTTTAPWFGANFTDTTNESIKKLESLPAKDYPQGNWGTEIDGFQLSCRFEKTTFTNGEPIMATILVRNISTNLLMYTDPPIRPVYFIVSTEQGETIPWRMPRYWMGGPSRQGNSISPGTQHKYQARLNDGYTLTNETYIVNVYLDVYSQQEKISRVESGKAKITILPANPPEEPKTNSPAK